MKILLLLILACQVAAGNPKNIKLNLSVLTPQCSKGSPLVLYVQPLRESGELSPYSLDMRSVVAALEKAQLVNQTTSKKLSLSFTRNIQVRRNLIYGLGVYALVLDGSKTVGLAGLSKYTVKAGIWETNQVHVEFVTDPVGEQDLAVIQANALYELGKTKQLYGLAKKTLAMKKNASLAIVHKMAGLSAREEGDFRGASKYFKAAKSLAPGATIPAITLDLAKDTRLEIRPEGIRKALGKDSATCLLGIPIILRVKASWQNRKRWEGILTPDSVSQSLTILVEDSHGQLVIEPFRLTKKQPDRDGKIHQHIFYLDSQTLGLGHFTVRALYGAAQSKGFDLQIIKPTTPRHAQICAIKESLMFYWQGQYHKALTSAEQAMAKYGVKVGDNHGNFGLMLAHEASLGLGQDAGAQSYLKRFLEAFPQLCD